MDIVVNPLSSLSHSNSGSYNGSSKQKNAPPRGLNGAGGDNRKKNPISVSLLSFFFVTENLLIVLFMQFTTIIAP